MGYWESEADLKANWSVARRWSPSMDGDERERTYRTWQRAVGRTLDWLE